MHTDIEKPANEAPLALTQALPNPPAPMSVDFPLKGIRMAILWRIICGADKLTICFRPDQFRINGKEQG